MYVVLFLTYCLMCLAIGYTARRRGWMREQLSRPIHLHTVIWTWSPVMLFSLWHLRIDTQLLTVMAIQVVVMLAAWGLMAVLGRLIGCGRDQIGVMILAAVISNQGFSLGSFLCYRVLDPPRDALGYASAYLGAQIIVTVLVFYAVAQHYAGEHRQPLGRLIARGLFGLPAAPLYCAAAGIGLSLGDVPYPDQFVERSYILEICFIAGAAGGYGGIGLRLRLGDSIRYLRHHVVLAVTKFIALPALTIGLMLALGFTVAHLNPLPFDVLMIESAMPAALAAVMISNMFGLDARLASVVWLWNTLLFCVVPLPVILWCFV